MELKYNVGDEVFVKAIVKSIKVTKGYKDSVDIVYNLTVHGAYDSAVSVDECMDKIEGSVKSGVPISELQNLYKEMGNIMYIGGKDVEPVTNVLDSCRAMLLDVIESYSKENDEQ